MPMYRKKPKTVDAVQFTDEANPPRGVRIGVLDGDLDVLPHNCFYVETIQGQRVVVQVGEWIIDEGDAVHFYPCADSVFRKDHEMGEEAAVSEIETLEGLAHSIEDNTSCFLLVGKADAEAIRWAVGQLRQYNELLSVEHGEVKLNVLKAALQDRVTLRELPALGYAIGYAVAELARLKEELESTEASHEDEEVAHAESLDELTLAKEEAFRLMEENVDLRGTICMLQSMRMMGNQEHWHLYGEQDVEFFLAQYRTFKNRKDDKDERLDESGDD